MDSHTIALYDQDAYHDRFTAKVLSCTKDEQDGKYHIILDQTCFFPEQGGQSADTGWINDDVRVLDVRIHNGMIEHVTDQPLSTGIQVHGRIDFPRRFDFMQHHTGEHIFSGFVFSSYGFHNVGFHLSDRTVSMDYDGPLSMEQARAIEWQANQVVWRNLPVQISWPSDEELEHISYRSKKEIDGRLRLVTIPEVDVCACCAPHVHKTGEIGQLRVLSAARYKGGTRLHIVCGGRAIKEARRDADLLSASSQLLSCSGENLSHQINALLEKEKELNRMIDEIKAAELMRQIDDVPASKNNVILTAGPISEKTASAAADRLIQNHTGICGVVFQDGSNQRVVLVSKMLPLRAAAQTLRQTTGFKGSGDDGCIRGMTEMDADRLEEWLDHYTASR